MDPRGRKPGEEQTFVGTGPVLVTGAGGFLGKDLIRHLLDQGFHARAMLRWGTVSPFHPDDRLEWVHADMRDVESLKRAVMGSSAVVHLAAAKNDEPYSLEVNVTGARLLVDACRIAGCSRLINVSTQSAKIGRKGRYGLTKSAADQTFHSAGLSTTTLRPSVIYGEGKSGVFGFIAYAVQKSPLIPVLGDGNWLSAPVYVGDVSSAICSCLRNRRTIGKTYDIGGPELVTLDGLIDGICGALKVRRRKVHVPFRMALLGARVLSAILPRSPVTVSNVLVLSENTRIDIEPARNDFGFDPIPLDRGLTKVFQKSSLTAEGMIAADFRRIARYLIDVDPEPELVRRYLDAHKLLLGGVPCSEINYVRRHPAALPYLDAAAGVLASQSQFRRQIVVAAAILEASPRHADIFLKTFDHRAKALWQCVVLGVVSAFKILVGVPWLLMIRES